MQLDDLNPIDSANSFLYLDSNLTKESKNEELDELRSKVNSCALLSFVREVINDEMTKEKLARALEEKEDERKKILIKKNADGRGLLEIAICDGDLEIVKTLLEEGADPNDLDGEGLCVVSIALYFGYYDIAEELLAAPWISIDSFEKSWVHPLSFCSKADLAKEERLASIKEKLFLLGAKEEDADKIFYSKMLGHIWSAEGFFKIPKANFKYEGFTSDIILPFIIDSTERYRKEIEEKINADKTRESKKFLYLGRKERLEKNFQDIPFHLYAPVLTSALSVIQEAEGGVEKWDINAISKRIYEGETVLLPYSWPGHALSLVFSKIGEDYFLTRCNKGEACREDFPLSIKVMPKPSLETIKNSLKRLVSPANPFFRPNYFNHGIEDDLKLEEFSGIDFRHQRTGNCAWETLKIAFVSIAWTAIYRDRMSEKIGMPSFFSSEEKENEEKKKIALDSLLFAKDLYKNWWGFLRSYVLEKYLSAHKPQEVDERLLNFILKKLEKKDQTLIYQKELNKKVHALLKKNEISFDSLYFQGQLEESIASNVSGKSFKVLLDQGTKVDVFSSEGELDLMALAVKYGRIEIFDQILERSLKSISSTTDKNKSTLLHIAVENKQDKMLKHLLSFFKRKEEALVQ
jgi:ankyrin repeat protein